MAITVRCGNVDQGTGDIRATVDACHFEVTDLDVNDTDGTPKQYRFMVDPSDPTVVGSGYSHLFTPNADGWHEWDGFIFPEDGSWTVSIYDVLEEDDDVQTLSVTVVAPS
jgi:hypothetical protein